MSRSRFGPDAATDCMECRHELVDHPAAVMGKTGAKRGCQWADCPCQLTFWRREIKVRENE